MIDVMGGKLTFAAGPYSPSSDCESVASYARRIIFAGDT